MTNLVMERTSTLPQINFNAVSGVLRIEGRSIPEDPGAFYSVVEIWVAEYFKDPRNNTKFEFLLEYINSGSSKFLLSLLHSIKKACDSGIKCSVDWYYEEDDETLFELGEHFKNSVKIPFNLLPIY